MAAGSGKVEVSGIWAQYLDGATQEKTQSKWCNVFREVAVHIDINGSNSRQKQVDRFLTPLTEYYNQIIQPLSQE